MNRNLRERRPYLAPEQRKRADLRELAELYKSEGDLRVFAALRKRPRRDGAKLDLMLLAREITPRDFFRRLRKECADEYALGLNNSGVVRVDIRSQEHKRMTRGLALLVLQAFKNVDPDDKSAVCVAMARTWHRFVKIIHRRYGLPTVQQLRAVTKPESIAEELVLESNYFEIPMTAEEKADWEQKVR